MMLWLLALLLLAFSPCAVPAAAAAAASPGVSNHSPDDVPEAVPKAVPEASRGSRGEEAWLCPQVERAGEGGARVPVTCSCDLPHTLRCTGGPDTLQRVGAVLLSLPPRHVSLLEVTVQGLSSLGPLPALGLHGLVVSASLKSVSAAAFKALREDGGGSGPKLQALGLPDNRLEAVPTEALATLPGLDRLDLSHNKLRSLHVGAFDGLGNLTFLDLSENQLSDIAAGAFRSLQSLRVLQLSSNRLKLASPSSKPSALGGFAGLAGLAGLISLRELDLSSNQLVGPLGPGALPRLGALRVLSLAHNQVSSVRAGALQGLPGLTFLSLQHNMVDVLEDNAFRALESLVSLDLSHNRIVAVSGASLAHLRRLRSLFLQNNFLRALSADLLRPLASLQELHLDDNDISLVATDALEPLEGSRLSRLTLAENPLNCDCALRPFAQWLRNSSLSDKDRASAVCAAPPHLENGLVAELGAPCKDGLEDAGQGPGRPAQAPPAPTSERVQLRALHLDTKRLSLLWAVEASDKPYVCDALFIYEASAADTTRDAATSGGLSLGSVHESLVANTPLGCDSSQLADPRSLLLSLPAPAAPRPGQHSPGQAGLVHGRRYRFCLVLLEGGGADDDLALVKGCSDVLPLVETAAQSPQSVQDLQPRPVTVEGSSAASPVTPRVSGLSANMTPSGSLAVWVQLSPPPPASRSSPCHLSVTVFADAVQTTTRKLNCSMPGTLIGGVGLELQKSSALQVCVTVGDAESALESPWTSSWSASHSPIRTRCTSVVVPRAVHVPGADIRAEDGGGAGLVAGLAAAGLLGGGVAALLLALWLGPPRGWGRVAGRGVALNSRLGMDRDTGRLYRPPPAPDHEQHARYVKLESHVTTRL